LHRFRMDTARHEVVTLVAQHADELGGEHLVEHRDDALAVGLVALGYRALLHMLARVIPDPLDVRNKLAHRHTPPCRRLRPGFSRRSISTLNASDARKVPRPWLRRDYQRAP